MATREEREIRLCLQTNAMEQFGSHQNIRSALGMLARKPSLINGRVTETFDVIDELREEVGSYHYLYANQFPRNNQSTA